MSQSPGCDGPMTPVAHVACMTEQVSDGRTCSKKFKKCGLKPGGFGNPPGRKRKKAIDSCAVVAKRVFDNVIELRQTGRYPNPIPVQEVRRLAKVRREVLCRHYDYCLDLAVECAWEGFSCEECRSFVPLNWDLEQWVEDTFACEALLYAIENLDALNQLRPSSIIEYFRNEHNEDPEVFYLGRIQAMEPPLCWYPA